MLMLPRRREYRQLKKKAEQKESALVAQARDTARKTQRASFTGVIAEHPILSTVVAAAGGLFLFEMLRSATSRRGKQSGASMLSLVKAGLLVYTTIQKANRRG